MVMTRPPEGAVTERAPGNLNKPEHDRREKAYGKYTHNVMHGPTPPAHENQHQG
jgi:hypothetical protein